MAGIESDKIKGGVIPTLKRGVIYTNVDPKKNNFVNSIIPVADRVVSERLFLCFEKKGESYGRSEPNKVRKAS
jgi:hypothetical protein